MEREACVCDHGFERSDLCAEIIIIIIIIVFLVVWLFGVPALAINAIVQYNGGLLPDILLLNQAPICVWFDGIIIYYVLLLPL